MNHEKALCTRQKGRIHAVSLQDKNNIVYRATWTGRSSSGLVCPADSPPGARVPPLDSADISRRPKILSLLSDYEMSRFSAMRISLTNDGCDGSHRISLAL